MMVACTILYASPPPIDLLQSIQQQIDAVSRASGASSGAADVEANWYHTYCPHYCCIIATPRHPPTAPARDEECRRVRRRGPSAPDLLFRSTRDSEDLLRHETRDIPAYGISGNMELSGGLSSGS